MEVNFKRDGLKLNAELIKPKDEKTFDLLILFEGLRGDHTHATAKGVADEVNKNGFATLNLDFESRGKSDGAFSDMTLLGQLLDAAAALKYAQSITGVKKIYLAGHSTGGLVAPLLAGYFHDQIDGLILISPALSAIKDARKGNMFGKKFDPNHVPDYISLPTSNKIHQIKFQKFNILKNLTLMVFIFGSYGAYQFIILLIYIQDLCFCYMQKMMKRYRINLLIGLEACLKIQNYTLLREQPMDLKNLV